MLAKLLNHLRGQYLGAIALFVALGGTGYAAANLPSNSVGTKQLRRGAVTATNLAKNAVRPTNLDQNEFGGYVRAYAELNGGGQIVSARPAAKVIAVAAGAVPEITIRWSRQMPRACFAMTTTVNKGDVSYASALFAGGGRGGAYTNVSVSGPDHPVNVVIVCPSR